MEKELKEWHQLHLFHQGCDYQTKDLAVYLKVSCRTIQRWLKETAKPSIEKIQLIKKYLLGKETDS